MVATLYSVRVHHRRLRPKVYDLAHDLWALKIDLAALETLACDNLLGGTSPLSLDARDFGPRDGSDLLTWFRTSLRTHGFCDIEPLELVFLPRFRGKGFAPLSVWMSPEALLFEVHNTAGEAHTYAVRRETMPDQQAWKRLWVSPFTPMHGRYDFRFAAGPDGLDLRVRLHDAAGLLLQATMTGPGQPLTPTALTTLQQRPGVLGRGIFRRILWHALRLRLLGLRPRWGAFAPAYSISTSVPNFAKTGP